MRRRGDWRNMLLRRFLFPTSRQQESIQMLKQNNQNKKNN